MTLEIEQIEHALEALWTGATGATVQAILDQPTLVGLAYVRAYAQGDTPDVKPTDAQIARACQSCIAASCDAVDPEMSVTAKTVLGLEQGSKGISRRARRERIENREDKYRLSQTQLTHRRGAKPSYEKRIIRDVAVHMHLCEEDFVGRGPDFRLIEYFAILTLREPGGAGSEERRFVIEARRDGAKTFEYQESPACLAWRPGRVEISDLLDRNDSYNPISYTRMLEWHVDGPKSLFTFLEGYPRDELLSFRLDTNYAHNVYGQGADRLAVEFDTRMATTAVDVCLCLRPPPGVKRAEIEIVDLADGTVDRRWTEPDEDHVFTFEVNDDEICPNAVYRLSCDLDKLIRK
jgi:hypothetical protein